jgi:hypothetical protein
MEAIHEYQMRSRRFGKVDSTGNLFVENSFGIPTKWSD